MSVIQRAPEKDQHIKRKSIPKDVGIRGDEVVSAYIQADYPNNPRKTNYYRDIYDYFQNNEL